MRFGSPEKFRGVKQVFKVQMIVVNTTRDGIVVVAESHLGSHAGQKSFLNVWNGTTVALIMLNTADIYKSHEELLKTQEGLSFQKTR